MRSAIQKGRKITWGCKISSSLRKLTTDQETIIRTRIEHGEHIKAIAVDYGVHPDTINKVRKGTYR